MRACLEAQFSLPYQVESGQFVGLEEDGVEVIVFAEDRGLTVMVKLDTPSFEEALLWCRFYAARTVQALQPLHTAHTPSPIKIVLIDSENYAKHFLEPPDPTPWPIPIP